MKKVITAIATVTAAAMAVTPVMAATELTVFNSKSEIQFQFEEMAQEYSAEKGVDVEVYYSNDTVAAHMATKYSSNDPYTIAMVDAKDIYSLGPEHAIDVSDLDFIKNTN